MVAAGLLVSVEAWPKADSYYGGKLQEYLNNIAEIKKGKLQVLHVIVLHVYMKHCLSFK